MSTLTVLKATIADDINRSDLTSQIAAAITNAINHYQASRFFFNESRGLTFATVAAQSRYSSSDDTDIPKFVSIDAVFLIDSSSIAHELRWRDPVEMENLLDSSASSGRPHDYTYFANGFQFYPIPDAAYTIRPVGLVKVDEPATDAEANNAWMTSAAELIRCRAKAYLAVHVLKDPDMAMLMQLAERDALSRLRSETNKKATSNTIRATQF